MIYQKFIAHRGLHGISSAAENSLSAFENAASRGFAIELDIRFTRDKKMIVFHDPDLTRMCGENISVADCTYEELRGYRLAGGSDSIPAFAEVLKLVGGRVPLYIELKDSPHVKDAEKRAAHLLEKYCGEYVVQSFDPLALMRFRSVAPDVPRGQLVSTYKGEKLFLRRLASKKAAFALSKPDYFAWDLRSVTLEAAVSAAERGAKFVSWTADSIELLETALEFSDSVIFENIPLDYFSDKI